MKPCVVCHIPEHNLVKVQFSDGSSEMMSFEEYLKLVGF